MRSIPPQPVVARPLTSETTCRSTGYHHLQCSTSRLSGTRARVRMPGTEGGQSAVVHVQKQFRPGLWIGYRDMKRETPGSAVQNPYSRLGFLFSVLCPSLPTYIYSSWRVHVWTDLPELSVQQKKPQDHLATILNGQERPPRDYYTGLLWLTLRSSVTVTMFSRSRA